MKVRTKIRAGAYSDNHNATRPGVKVKARIRAGASAVNRNGARPGVKVKTRIRAGTGFNNNRCHLVRQASRGPPESVGAPECFPPTSTAIPGGCRELRSSAARAGKRPIEVNLANLAALELARGPPDRRHELALGTTAASRLPHGAALPV